MATSPDGWTWTPIACLETATVAACAEATCAADELTWALAAELGGGRCDVVLNPPPEVEDAATCATGCGRAGAAGILLPLLLFRSRSRRPA